MIFEEFGKNNIINVILDSIDSSIDNMVEIVKQSLNKVGQKINTDIIKLELIMDLVKSIEKYTQPTDILVDISTSISLKGNVEIFAKIQRDGISYTLTTEAIYAGGHNIQKLHYRYITKTKLPRTENESLANLYTNKLKKLKDTEKIKNEISENKLKFLESQKQVEQNSKLSDVEILNILKIGKNWYEMISWEEIVDRGADKTWGGEGIDEISYKKLITDNQTKQIEMWKRVNITIKDNDNKLLSKYITKLENKLKTM
jgi:hypothetical protein